MNKKIKIGLIIIVFIISLISTKAYATNAKANQETVRMRKEASTDSGIVTLISLNEEVEILSEEGQWYKIKYKAYTGYVRKDMLDVEGKTNNETNTNTASQSTETKNEENIAGNTVEENTSNENTTTTETSNETTNNVNKTEDQKDQLVPGFEGTISSKIELKLVPSITSSNINTIDENTKITIKETMNKWSYIEANEKTGWVLTGKIQLAEQKNQETQKEETNKPEEKQEESKETKTTEETKKTEEKTTTTSQEKTETTKKTTEVTKYVSAETLNMRETADNNGKLINQLKVNTKVTVVEEAGTWSKIKVNGKTGYVASKYLSDKKVDVTSRSEEITRNNNNEETSSNTTNTKTEETTKTENTNTAATSSVSGSSIVAFAKKYKGYKYVSGGSSPSTGFDCSGFTSYVYKQFGITISRTSGAQASNGTAVAKSNLQPGDLVIFNNRANTSIGHVGIYIGGNMFIHAGSSATGVITTSLSDSYYQARYVTGRRIIN